MVGCTPTTIPLPTSVSPISGNRGQTLDVTIYGTDFLGTTSVYFGPDVAIQVNSFEVISSSEIQANIYIYQSATLGPKDVGVTSPDGTGEGEKLFTVVGLPSIWSITPTSGAQGSFLDVTIQGEGFYGVTNVSFGSGITVTDYSAFSEYVPVTIIATINISSTATPGTRNITVTTTHGTVTGSGLFTVTAAVPGPVVSSVTPDDGLLGSTFDVSIKGSNFTGTPTVSFGTGIDVNSVTLISTNEIQANISISSGAVLGDRDVSVTIGSVTGVGEDLFYVYTLI